VRGHGNALLSAPLIYSDFPSTRPLPGGGEKEGGAFSVSIHKRTEESFPASQNHSVFSRQAPRLSPACASGTIRTVPGSHTTASSNRGPASGYLVNFTSCRRAVFDRIDHLLIAAQSGRLYPSPWKTQIGSALSFFGWASCPPPHIGRDGGEAAGILFRPGPGAESTHAQAVR